MRIPTQPPIGDRISRRGLLVSLLSLFPAARRLRAQHEPTFSSDVKVVNLFATVRTKQGEIVRNLAKDDFALEEDGRPQTIRYFSQESNLPLTLGLLVDTSLSQRRVLDDEQRASFRFLDQVLREDKDLAFVIHFDFDVELLQDLTSSRKKLEAALTTLETPRPPRQWGGTRLPPGSGGGGGRRGGGTCLYDAVLLASDELMKNQSGRKALVILSDGVDTGSKVTLASGIEAAQRADTLVYSILFYDEQAYGSGYGGGYGGPRMGRGGRRGPVMRAPVSHPDGKKILQRISRETGGGFFEVSKKQPIEKTYDRIQEELRHQYSMGYTPERVEPASGFHRIHLTTKQKDLVVQTREGYYAQG